MKKLDGTEVTHGNAVAYTFHKCRCEICKKAQAERMRNWRKKNPSKNKQNVYNNVEKQRELVRSGKNKPCTDCGVQYPYYTMQYDHARGVKKYDMATIFRRSTAKILAEMEKCDVVCANCHTERTFQRAQVLKKVNTNAV